MANSFVLYTGNGSTTQFSIAGIDGWITSGFLKVYLNDVLQTTGYTLIDLTTATPKVQFTSAPATGVVIRVQRETPATIASFKSNVVDFNDGSILTAADLDKVVEGLLHVAQEAEDTGSGAIGKTVDQANWNADSRRITNMDPGLDDNDAVTFQQLQTAALYGSPVSVPQAWALTGTGTATYALSPAPLSTTEEMFIVEVGGVIQEPSTYTITPTDIVFDGNIASGLAISVRNLGIARSLTDSVTTAMLNDDAVTTAKINALAVTDAKLASNAVTTAKVANDAITYAKIQNVSATDRILGRSSAGAGDVEEITCTAAGRALLDDASAAFQRATLGLGSLAIISGIADSNVVGSANIQFSKLQTVDANSLLGNNTGSAATASSLDAAQVMSLLGAATWNTNRVGAINLLYGTGTIAASNTAGSASVTNASALSVGSAAVAITAQSLTSAFEVTAGTSIRPTSATGGTWFVILTRFVTANTWAALALRTA